MISYGRIGCRLQNRQSWTSTTYRYFLSEPVFSWSMPPETAILAKMYYYYWQLARLYTSFRLAVRSRWPSMESPFSLVLNISLTGNYLGHFSKEPFGVSGFLHPFSSLIALLAGLLQSQIFICLVWPFRPPSSSSLFLFRSVAHDCRIPIASFRFVIWFPTSVYLVSAVQGSSIFLDEEILLKRRYWTLIEIAALAYRLPLTVSVFAVSAPQSSNGESFIVVVNGEINGEAQLVAQQA